MLGKCIEAPAVSFICTFVVNQVHNLAGVAIALGLPTLIVHGSAPGPDITEMR